MHINQTSEWNHSEVFYDSFLKFQKMLFLFHYHINVFFYYVHQYF